jgi:integrase
MPHAFRRAPRAWSQEEHERLVATARRLPGKVGQWPLGDWLPALMLTCLSTNWRITAVMGLRTANCSLANRAAFSIETKQHAERCARLTVQTVEALERIWGPRDTVFQDWPYDRGARQWKNLNNLLGMAIEAAEVPDIGRWHAFRKTGCTLVWDRLGAQAAAQFAGHFSPATTERYYLDRSKLTGPAAADTLSTRSTPSPALDAAWEWM